MFAGGRSGVGGLVDRTVDVQVTRQELLEHGNWDME